MPSGRSKRKLPRGLFKRAPISQNRCFLFAFSSFFAFLPFCVSVLPRRRRRPPRRPQNDPRGLQVGPKTAAEGLRTAEEGFPGAARGGHPRGPGGSSAPESRWEGRKRAKRLPRSSQDGPRGPRDAQDGLQTAQDAAKTLQEASQRPPKRAPRGQNR